MINYSNILLSFAHKDCSCAKNLFIKDNFVLKPLFIEEKFSDEYCLINKISENSCNKLLWLKEEYLIGQFHFTNNLNKSVILRKLLNYEHKRFIISRPYECYMFLQILIQETFSCIEKLQNDVNIEDFIKLNYNKDYLKFKNLNKKAKSSFKDDFLALINPVLYFNLKNAFSLNQCINNYNKKGITIVLPFLYSEVYSFVNFIASK